MYIATDGIAGLMSPEPSLNSAVAEVQVVHLW